MKISRVVVAALTAGTALLLPVGAASADVTVTGSGSILGGNQINAPINAPVNVCGIAIGILGNSVSACAGP